MGSCGSIRIALGIIRGLQVKFSIDQILIGPSVKILSELSKKTFQRALKGTEFENLTDRIHTSTIPLRPSK